MDSIFEPVFSDRIDAGQKLAQALSSYADQKETLVLALPRGGIVTGLKVAHTLHLPFDIIVSRKIGAPHNPELAIGAIVEDEILLNDQLIKEMEIPQDYIDQVIEKEHREIERRKRTFRKGRLPIQFDQKQILLIDDGVSTGTTIRAAIHYLKKQPISKLLAAIPVGPLETVEKLKNESIEVICLKTPEMFMAVGQFYEKYTQVNDKMIIGMLNGS